MKWPEEVPVLEARDIHRDSLDGPNGTHCLLGWRVEVFGYGTEEVRGELKELCRGSVSAFNDDRRNSKAKIARVWNQAMANLGYIDGNPVKARKK